MPSPSFPLRLLACVLALLCLPSGARAAPPAGVTEPPAARHVLLVSLDGVAWPRLQRALPRLPTLSRLAAAGTSAPLTSVFPSLTWPAHTSLVTGRRAGGHGVLGNRFWDRRARKVVEFADLGWPASVRAAPLWQLARSRGLRTAALLWPQTVGAADLDWNLPELRSQADFDRALAAATRDELTRAGLPVQQLGRIGKDELFLSDSFVRDAAVHLVRTHRPGLLLVHFLAVDTAAHQFGPESRAVDWALDLADRYLGDILAAVHEAGLADRTDVLVVSDHGFLAISKYADPLEVLRLAGVKVRGLGLAVNGHALFVSAPDADQGQAIAGMLRSRLASLPEVDSVLDGQALHDLGIPTRAQDPRAPDLVVVARPDVFWLPGKGRRYRGPVHTKGMHGFPPGPPELQGIFVAAGPGIRQGARAPADLGLCDVAVLAAHLLGTAFPTPVDGRLPEPLLRR